MRPLADQTALRRLLEPILDQGIKTTNYTNGRVLTADALVGDQQAGILQHRQLGQGIGEGVIRGLEVAMVDDGAKGGPPIVAIAEGLAVNRNGRILAQPLGTLRLALERSSAPAAPPAALFQDCVPQVTSTAPPGTAVCVLVVSPASGYDDAQVPMVGVKSNGKAIGCGFRWAVEGVQFRLVELDASAILAQSALLTRTDPAGLSMLRNLFSHACYGTATLAGFEQDPFRLVSGASPYVAYGALDDLRASGKLTPCDVPLALLLLSPGGVRFLDTWSVRRRPVEALEGAPWQLHVGQRRLAEAEAMFLQFEGQVQDALLEPSPSTITATSRFRYLPAAGYLPTGPGEFSEGAFFQGLTIEKSDLDPAFLRLLVQQSWLLDPIDLANPPTIRVFEAPAGFDYLLFVREEKLPPPTGPTTTPTPGEQPAAETGSVVADVTISTSKVKVPTGGSSKTRETAKGAAHGKGGILASPIEERRDIVKEWIDESALGTAVRVVATDRLGHEYPLQHVPSRRRLGSAANKQLRLLDETMKFRRTDLPTGTYQVTATATGARRSSAQAEVVGGGTTTVSLTLVPDTREPGKPPRRPGRFDGSWIDPGWYATINPIDQYIHWPWPPPEERPGFDPVVDPVPDDVYQLAQEWVDWVQEAYPGAPVDSGGIQLYKERGYTPDATPENAYAYLVFGEQGAYLPVVLTPTGRTLDRDVPLTKGGIAGMDEQTAGQLAAAGVTSVDVLGASWQALVSDALGVAGTTATRVVGDARASATSLQGSLRVFAGVDAALEESLKAHGVDSPVALANADPQGLVSGLAGAGMTQAFAERLVGEARAAIPASEWSLDATTLGLKEEEIASLGSLGITSQGMLKARAADNAVKGQIATVLGRTTAQVDAIANQVSIKDLGTVRGERAAAAPVVEVAGVNRETGVALARLGISSVGSLASAAPDALLAAFGGSQAAAQAAVAAASASIVAARG